MSLDVLSAYFVDIERRLLELSNCYVEQFLITRLTPDRANLKLRLRFQGEFLLAISEAVFMVNEQITTLDYRYHFQDGTNQLVFRYDSTPHFPNLATFPHHKHLRDRVISIRKPEVCQVFDEAIDYVSGQD